MSYFLDSNVLIGYVFRKTDIWGDPANVVVEDDEENNSSTVVWGECFGSSEGGKCNTIQKKISREFRRAIAKLNSGLSDEEILSFARDEKWRILSILKSVFDGNKESSSLVLIKLLRDVQRRYDIEYVDRFNKLKEIVTIHNRDNPYLEICKILEGFIEDWDDIQVILDAHYVGFLNKNIILITGDYNHIVPNKKIICTHTSLVDVKGLGDYRAKTVI